MFEDNVQFQDFQRFYSPGPEGIETPEMDVSVDHGVAVAVRFLEQRGRFHSDHIYSHTVRGFAARLTREQILQLENDRLVSYIEPDAIMSIHQEKPPPGATTTGTRLCQWGIDRIDADRSSTLAGNGSGTVTKVNVYIIDTGVASHVDLNLVAHVNFVAGSPNTDCHGHGTHVSGTVAARDNATAVVGSCPELPSPV